ncbi:ribonuclease H-like domain-containing protein [Baffinella frigidus]|nr:ribonuclease H-like domain-containing protein [Cryptophyta sp. CCMP2293]
MVDVTVENFENVLEELRRLLPYAEFVAVDCEFTGVDVGEGDHSAENFSASGGSASSGNSGDVSMHGYATQEEEAQMRYEKMRAATSFLVVQVGICPFMWDTKKRTYESHPFNFYVYPRDCRGLDRRFLSEARCISFLSNGGFDFNKLFRSGIPFLNHEQETQARSLDPHKGASFIASLRADLAAFLNSSEGCTTLPPVDGFHRMLTWRELNGVFKEVLRGERDDVDGKSCIRVSRKARQEWGSTVEEIKKAIAGRAAELDNKELNDAIGFRHVMDLLGGVKKPLVGHNMLLDLVQLEAHFSVHPPALLSDYVATVHRKYPVVVDTKHLVEAGPENLTKFFSGGSRLDAIFKTVSSAPFKMPPALHEAGYDAHITGIVFLRLAHYLTMTAASHPLTAAQVVAQRLAPESTGLTPRIRDMNSSARPFTALLDRLFTINLANCLHLMGGTLVKSVNLQPALANHQLQRLKHASGRDSPQPSFLDRDCHTPVGESPLSALVRCDESWERSPP